MPTYLLDTSVIIDTLNGKKERTKFLSSLLEHGHMLACCATNVSKIYAGMRPKEERKTQALLERFDHYDITWVIARQAGLLKRDYSRKGRQISLADATIAAVCLTEDLTLLTDNTKDFPMPELKLYPLPKDGPNAPTPLMV